MPVKYLLGKEDCFLWRHLGHKGWIQKFNEHISGAPKNQRVLLTNKNDKNIVFFKLAYTPYWNYLYRILY